MAMGVEGIVLSPGYSYDKAPDQKHFMGRARVRRLFRAILSNRKKSWKFNMSPLFLEFLMGDRNYECTPWGSPAYNIFGWQRPCYLLAGWLHRDLQGVDGNDAVGRIRRRLSGNPKCANCMVSCGYEPSAVLEGFGSLKGFLAMVKGTFSLYPDQHALNLLNEPMPTGPSSLVNIGSPSANWPSCNLVAALTTGCPRSLAFRDLSSATNTTR